jgi:hypothetical protein
MQHAFQFYRRPDMEHPIFTKCEDSGPEAVSGRAKHLLRELDHGQDFVVVRRAPDLKEVFRCAIEDGQQP